MPYRVLARKYRSATFDEVVGQEAIATTLKNAISSGRVHHGYLFTGTRGVGKTSMARILAKALNCLSFDAPTTTPCGRCNSCVAVAAGEDVDVVEIDAASNTGVDDMRELRSNAAFRPARSRYKVYIIDEVHMLSTNAFNALLKTLEEPPPHVKFILATTEPQKVPATIQSRCQRFDFRSIGAESIAGQLRTIVDAENVPADEAVLRRIARLANGSMRDALSLLDKVLSYSPERITAALADEVIPPAHDEPAAAVMRAVADGDARGALGALDAALQSGRTVDRFCDHLIDYARTLMLLGVCGRETELVDVAAQLRPALAEQAARFDAPTYVYMITLLEELRRQVKYSGAARALADAAVVRLAMSIQFSDISELLARLERGEVNSPPSHPTKNTDTGSTPQAGREFTTQTRIATVRPGVGSGGGPSSVPQTPAASPAGQGNSSVKDAQAHRVTPTLASDWARVASDPLVQRIKDAVDGTLVDIRPASLPAAPQATLDEDIIEDSR